MKYIILCAGKGTRWNNYLGVPKHLITINGETLLGRTTRLLKENNIQDYIITSSDERYAEYGNIIKQTYNDCEIDRFEETNDEEICYLYGDVYYTEDAIKNIVETDTDEILFFGSDYEIFAIKIKDKKLFFSHKKKVKELYLKGEINRCIGWEVYRSLNSIPFDEHLITDRYFKILDGTDDIDFPEDYERFKKDKEKIKIVVLSCDKNEDTFEAFHHCIEKYWKRHPEIIYATESVKNPYYKTICKNYPLDLWTKRIRETLAEVDSEQIILIVDDVFIRNDVDTKRIEYASQHLNGNIACFNFEKQFDNNDIDTGLFGFKKRNHGSSYEVSILCGLWQKDKLIKVLSVDSDPWSVEYAQKNYGFDYYINSGDYIIDWGYVTYIWTGICKGKWCRNVVPFFEKEGIKIDYDKRGFVD